MVCILICVQALGMYVCKDCRYYIIKFCYFIGGVDYDLGPYTVTFTAGIIHTSFNFSLIDDDVFENSENFVLTIHPSSLPNNVTVGDPGQVTVTIVDNDGKKLDMVLVIMYCKKHVRMTLYIDSIGVY